MNRLYDLDDICLIPTKISSIVSRDQIQPKVELFSGVILDIPIVAAPMMDVCNGPFALKMRELGGFGFIHRFSSIGDQVKEFYDSEKQGGCAVGLGPEGLERFDSLYKAGCRYFCLDVANGANKEILKTLSATYQCTDVHWIVGNVASFETYDWLACIQTIRGIRVGIAGGSACTTKNATGIYHPMGSLLREIRSYKDNGGFRDDPHNKNFLRSKIIIADGGINSPDRFCKALALGADVVMMGSTLAVAKESPAQKVNSVKYNCRNNPMVSYWGDSKENSAVFRGSASFEVQKEYREPRYVEGKEMLLPYSSESLEHIITKFMNGLRSSMSYFDAKTLEEYRTNVTFGTIA